MEGPAFYRHLTVSILCSDIAIVLTILLIAVLVSYTVMRRVGR